MGLWAGEHGDGESAKYWMRVLSEIKNRGIPDCLIVVCDGLKGLPEAIATVWPQALYRRALRIRCAIRSSTPRRRTGQFDKEIRTIIFIINSIESINARIRRAVNARGYFPTEWAH